MEFRRVNKRQRQQTALLILNQMAGPMTWELASDLAAAWGRVDLLTGHPDTLAKASQQGVQLHPACSYQRGSNLRRFSSWLRYVVRASIWLCRRPRSIPVLIFSNPPIGIWLGWLMNRVRGAAYAIMVHDIYPDAIVRMGVLSRSNLLTRGWRYLNRLAYERAQVVMTLGPHMAKHLEAQFDPRRTKAGKLIIVDPWADALLLQRRDKSDNWFAAKYEQVDKLTVMYSGNMGRGHDIESILAAAKDMQPRDDVSFMLIGAGPKWAAVDNELRRDRLNNVVLLPWQPEEDLPYTLTTADVGIVSLEPELTGLAVPSKAFYFLAAGVPIIALCEQQTELADVVHEFGCGCVISPGHPTEITATLRQLTADSARLDAWRAGAAAARKRFSRVRNTEMFLRTLETHLLRTSKGKSADVAYEATTSS